MDVNPRRVTAFDVILGCGLALSALLDGLAGADYPGGRARLTVALLLQTAPVVVRRLWPLAAVSVSAAGVALEVAGAVSWGDSTGFFAFLIFAYTLPRWGSRRDMLAGAVVLLAASVLHVAGDQHDDALDALTATVLPIALGGAAWVGGTVMRMRAERVTRLEADAADLDRTWAEHQQAVIDVERRRIARELHDIVGHALAGISLSAAAAEQRVALDAVDVRESLSLIRITSRDAAADVRRLVGLLRTPEDSRDLAPQPTLAGLDELVDRNRAAGVRVDLHHQGATVDLPLGMQLAVYRVVQEGLTNVVKHAAGAKADVVLRWSQHDLRVEVDNDGPVVRASRRRDGHGLTGLAERVALYGGTFTGGPLPQGGFRVVATLPLP